MDTIASDSTIQQICECVWCTPLCCIVSLVLQWLPVPSSVNFISYPLQHIPTPGMHMNLVSPLFDNLFLALCLLLMDPFPSFTGAFI